MTKIKNSDFQHILPFEQKKKNAFLGKCKTAKCFSYYYKNTKAVDYSITKTFHYIDRFYQKQEFKEEMSCKDRSKSLDNLIKRFDSLYYQSKISFSIVSSVAISIIITFLFTFLQLPNKDGDTYFSMFIDICSMRENLELTNMLQIVTVFSVQCILLLLYISIPVFIAWYTIVLVKRIYLIKTENRLIIIPYERDVIVKTIATYDYKVCEILKNND